MHKKFEIEQTNSWKLTRRSTTRSTAVAQVCTLGKEGNSGRPPGSPARRELKDEDCSRSTACPPDRPEFYTGWLVGLAVDLHGAGWPLVVFYAIQVGFMFLFWIGFQSEFRFLSIGCFSCYIKRVSAPPNCNWLLDNCIGSSRVNLFVRFLLSST